MQRGFQVNGHIFATSLLRVIQIERRVERAPAKLDYSSIIQKFAPQGRVTKRRAREREARIRTLTHPLRVRYSSSSYPTC